MEVKPSHKPEKKIDVFREGHLIGSVGAKGMGDYPTFLREKGRDYAEERRSLYKARHQKDRTKRWSKGWLADRLLW